MTRLTPRGVALLVASVGVGTAGVLLGYPLLRVLAGVGLGAVAAAFVSTRGRVRVEVVREVYPDRVQRGRPAFARLRVRGTGSRRHAGFVAGDRVGSGFHTVAVRPLPPGGEAVYHYELPTVRRGRHEVGPLTLERTDPLGLGRSRVTAGDTTTLWVHPRVHPVRAVVTGHPRHHHDGRTTERSPHGSLDVRDVREYVVGDEVRHLHWKATARTGRLMIRDYLDPEQPRFTALLDTRSAGDGFEEAVDFTASLLAASAGADHRCRLVTPCGADIPTWGGIQATRQLLDALCVLEPSAADGPLVPPTLGGSGGCLAVVTTRLDADDRVAIARLRYPMTVVVVVGGGTVGMPGARVLTATDAAEAARRWNAVVAG
ncbi:DUF58 domain-containing protein [Actinokineospora fastidiosa]|uniref:DUF58 domain-containing protein n=1 Tax=Actinokineospora fastidiosa TaxID=1816 RepID=A0A918GTD2_9PSEU|nr:DUF58 domain-containing protein [Actinokineospora fastidiosa]GGS60120.1 hypothetical protein GCM10010171_63800 [Actinokineospora fastidiosa]